MANSETLRAELEVAELEEELAAAKRGGNVAPRELKDRLREARQKYRIARAPWQGEEIDVRAELREARRTARENS